ncbi:hypothetical protein MNBD_GAMMA06-1527 [hydrothermal vent metagenome]|uniref:P/Homo B domain-containing protein n=1 Tax=hydrothermal vent metagenome TaxID=652676 RepID=A0A3B0W794_9ZZZZ
MKSFPQKTIRIFINATILLAASTASYAAETVCNDNGGAGFPFAVSSTTNINIPFLFGDVSEVFDINIFTDITKFYPGDLTARVTSPQGTTVELFERPGTALDEATTGPPYGCDQNDIIVTFDDEAGIGTNIENICGNGAPSIGGTFLSHLPAPNNLSAIDGEDPSGTWAFQLVHAEPFDPGNLNNVCITAAFAAVTFDKLVSTNNTCSDTLDTLTVTSGTDVYYCYTVSNPSTETFSINLGDAIDDQGHDISALETTYAQNASQTVVIGPITAGSTALPDNITTVNNAQVTATFATANFNGTLITDETASLTVNASPPPPSATGAKQLYFDAINTVSPDLTRVVPGGNTQTGNIDTLVLNQNLSFATPFTMTSGSTVNVQLRMRRRNGGGARTLQVQLINGGTGTVIGTGSTASVNAAGWQTVIVPINIGAAGATFTAGEFVRIVVDNIPATNGNIQIRTLDGVVRSEVQIPTSTVINVDTVAVFTAAYPAVTQLSSYEPTNTVYIRATVSDPFGNADITSADITITDSATAVRVNSAAMTSVATPTGATRIYEYQYTIPATPDGYWDLSVTANEGAETTISHTAQATMVVGSPAITISKNSGVLSDPINASNPKAIPGSIVNYTINASNAGFGYVDTNTFVVTDPLSPDVTFFFGSPVTPITFTDGTIPSGLSYTFSSLGSATDDIDFSNNGGVSFITPTTDASGFDTTSPPINYIQINPKGGFRGSDGINIPSVQLDFRVRVQ